MKRSVFYLSLAVIFAAFAALICAPDKALDGARRGLSVCAATIIPSLLPFLTLSALLNALGLPHLLSRAVGPLMRRLFGVDGAVAAPLLLGLTGGYPVGAVSMAELVRRGALTDAEGSRLLPFCNNTGPAFIIGAAGSGIFGSGRVGLLLYASHIGAAFVIGILCAARCGAPAGAASGNAEPAARSLAAALPESMAHAVRTVLNICGYVVFFSVIMGLLDALGLLSGLAGRIAALTGAELHFVRAALTGIIELGGGISAMSGLHVRPCNLALASFLLGFGGLSVHCQTLAAVAGTEIKTARNFVGRLLHGVLSALFTYVFSALLF
ncbi:MAG: sporulation protein [Oscillospiraceae bacterium]|nr:sporulation protein [Oscillospiraceae bacterium]